MRGFSTAKSKKQALTKTIKKDSKKANKKTLNFSSVQRVRKDNIKTDQKKEK